MGVGLGKWLRLPKGRENKRPFTFAAMTGAAVLMVSLIILELETSWLQSHVFAAIARRLTYTMERGPSPSVPYPHSGPYDFRLGYERLPEFLKRLRSADYEITNQARTTTVIGKLASRIVFPIYAEKTQAGLSILDRIDEPLFVARYPQRTYPDFESIPPLVVGALLFIENRGALGGQHSYRNPAVEWDRLGKAILDLGYSKLHASHAVSGGSTLATQLEKLRHSYGGRTRNAAEKLRQMASASLRAYLDGEQTLDARKRVIRDYINSMPLAALRGYGEVDGLGDGLWAWFGADFEAVNRMLRETALAGAPGPGADQARAFRRVLTLLLATRKPTAYLKKDRPALDARVNAYLRLLANEGVIRPALRDAALATSADYRDEPPKTEPFPFAERKADDSVRIELMSLLGAESAYDLDRLDLTVPTTIDGNAQRRVTEVLRRLGDPGYDSAAGLHGRWLLGGGDPSAVVYSFTLFERSAHGNLLRVQADNYDRPLDINEGSKLELGSTAKLRTLIHYLEIVSELHGRYSGISAEQLRAIPVVPQDRLTRWAVEYLSAARDNGLPAMLWAALARTYSASPDERFFTGGGIHTFANFDREEDGRIMTVREAFRKSVNLVFIRLMRDIVNHHIYRLPDVTPALLQDPGDPAREPWLRRFANMEGRSFVSRFYEKYRGQSPDRMLQTLVRGLRIRSASRLAVIYRSVRPQEGPDRFAAFLRAYPAGAGLSDKVLGELYEKYGPDKIDLADRGFLAGVHPLELWLIEYRARNPEATLGEILAAGANERQEVYRWLFKTGNKSAQDHRIRTMLELDAFREIHGAWKRLGFPFGSLVPSYATAIGSSGDNPAALAELMGILVNNGIHYPTLRVRELRFGEGTPFETVVEPRPAGGKRVLPSLLAIVVKQELVGVVKAGTARRVAGAFDLPDGTPVTVGGKTGTGDNRLRLFAGRGRPTGSRVVNRTATFAFLIDNRFFGTVTAFVPGPKAAGYGFTSALPVQILKNLAPTLMPLIGAGVDGPGPSETERWASVSGS